MPGTDNQQWFYEMECLGCGHKYYANGSDIWQRKCPKCRDVDLLERITAYVMADVGTPFSATSLVKFFKNEHRTVAAETILNYIKYCCDALLEKEWN